MNLKKIRTERELTQDALARSCGISRQRVTNYEIGIREPNIETLKKLAVALNVTVDELLKEETDDDQNEKNNTRRIEDSA